MIKKCVLVLGLIVITAGIVSAQSKLRMSMGAGGYFTNNFGGGIIDSSRDYKLETPYMGGGVYAFFDINFAELSVGMLAVNTKFKDGAGYVPDERHLYGIDIGLFGKFPFHLGENFTFYPLLGIDYRLVLTAKDDDGYQYQRPGSSKATPMDFSMFWPKAGVGFDIALNQTLFLRGEALYGVWPFVNRFERDAKTSSDAAKIISHGLTVKLALGYRFN